MMTFLIKSLAVVASFVGTLTVVRLVGKKEVSQMTFWDLVSAITLGALAADIVIARPPNILMGLWIIALWGALTWFVGWLVMKSQLSRELVQGTPTVLIHNGKIMEKAMNRERFNTDLLMTQLRSRGVFDVADVEFAVLEPDGKLSVLLKSQHLPVTPADLNLPTRYKGMSKELIKDGQIMDMNLAEVELTDQWLMAELERRGISDPKEVFHAEINTDGELYVDKFIDDVSPQHDPENP